MVAFIGDDRPVSGGKHDNVVLARETLQGDSPLGVPYLPRIQKEIPLLATFSL